MILRDVGCLYAACQTRRTMKEIKGVVLMGKGGKGGILSDIDDCQDKGLRSRPSTISQRVSLERLRRGIVTKRSNRRRHD